MFKVQGSKLNAQSSKLIEIEHLSAGYDGKQVLNDINLTVYQDDYLGIIGPNGGGKTTLMRLILTSWRCRRFILPTPPTTSPSTPTTTSSTP